MPIRNSKGKMAIDPKASNQNPAQENHELARSPPGTDQEVSTQISRLSHIGMLFRSGSSQKTQEQPKSRVAHEKSQKKPFSPYRPPSQILSALHVFRSRSF